MLPFSFVLFYFSAFFRKTDRRGRRSLQYSDIVCTNKSLSVGFAATSPVGRGFGFAQPRYQKVLCLLSSRFLSQKAWQRTCFSGFCKLLIVAQTRYQKVLCLLSSSKKVGACFLPALFRRKLGKELASRVSAYY